MGKDLSAHMLSNISAYVCCRESRYLLFLTENYAALSILQQDLLFHAENPPFVLFGSSFPKDREYTQVFSLLYA